jgi:4'-phosphopantetheinyl transferase
VEDALWSEAPKQSTLPAGEVHIWRAPLDLPASQACELAGTLSPDERDRAGRLRLPGPRARFVSARGCLRRILGYYLDARPVDLIFRYSDAGKPELAGPAARRGIRFNLSHTADLALFAVALDRELGIDIEHEARPVNARRIADRFFAAEEAAWLRRLPPEDHLQAFYRCWTRKEAYAKAVGEGLRLILRRFQITRREGDPVARVYVKGDPAQTDRWSIYDLEPGAGYVGALAVEGRPRQIRFWQAPPGGPRP